MKILILNGSPKGERSNTLQLTNAFIDGMGRNCVTEVEKVTLKDCKIEPCLSCFTCWTKTPGKCVIDDDMAALTAKYLEADVIIWSFPLYYFGMPSKTKAFLDRLLPNNLPFITSKNDSNHSFVHPSRYDLSGKKFVLISTCGLPATEHNYEALTKQFEIIYGGNFTPIYCPEGELFSVPYLRERIEEYLATVGVAGAEFATGGQVSDQTRFQLSQLLYPVEAFVEMADASWEIAGGEENTAREASEGKAFRFMRQMRATFHPGSAQGLNANVEIHFTDLGETYQLLIADNTCTLKVGAEKPSTTRITTTFATWQNISNGKMNGAAAMMAGLYSVTGDFDIMLKLDSLFGGGSSTSKSATTPGDKRTNMSLFLLPWIIIWVVAPFNLLIGAVAALLVACIIIPIGQKKWELTIYEQLNPLTILILTCLAIFRLATPEYIIISSYLTFSGYWLISSLSEVPLSAWYSRYGYGDDTFSNPLFMKTNRILTALWGLLYLLTTIWTYWLVATPLMSFSGAINSIAPVLMGVFTGWFSKWYPAKVARNG